MKHQALFTSKNKSKKLRCRLLQFLFGALRANIHEMYVAPPVRGNTLTRIYLHFL